MVVPDAHGLWVTTIIIIYFQEYTNEFTENITTVMAVPRTSPLTLWPVAQIALVMSIPFFFKF